MRQALDKKRKNPSQRRARQTVDTILEATAQLLERGDRDEFTTNHIARRAGFSIGTLYRYLPHKKAILKEMVEAGLRLQDTAAREGLAQVDGASGEQIIELAVRTTLKPFGRSRVRRRMLLELVRDADFVTRVNAAQLQTIKRFVAHLHALDPDRYREPSDRLCAILSGALLGSVRMTMFFDPDTLSDPDYESELVAIMRQIVTVRGEA